MSDESKTREELLEELRALRAQVQQVDSDASAVDAPRSQEGMTRREALGTAAWVAPVILSVSLSGAPAEAQKSRLFQRGQENLMTTVPTSFPTSFPTTFPTSFPTAPMAPTTFPTSFPTAPMAPTTFPTSFPTSSPTSSPTMSPTPVVPVELQTFRIE